MALKFGSRNPILFVNNVFFQTKDGKFIALLTMLKINWSLVP